MRYITKIGFIVLVIVFAVICLTPKNTYLERTKAVIFLDEKVGLNQKLTKENEIILEDCSEYQVDYDEEKCTILYLNWDGEIVERDRRTGTEEAMKIERLGVEREENEWVRNLQYAPGGVSFVVGESLYLWERNSNKFSKLLDSCAGSDGYNTYQWYGTDKVIFVSKGSRDDLNVWHKGKAEIEVIQPAVRSFVMNGAQEQIYMISYDVKVNAFGMEKNIKLKREM